MRAVTLEADGDAATKLTYTASAQVSGKLAQIGSRLVDGAARKIAGEFFKRFGTQLGGDGAAAPADGNVAAAEVVPQGSQPDEANGEEPGDDVTKRKKSWTAWISKS